MLDHTTEKMMDGSVPSECFLELAAPIREVSNQLHHVIVVKKGLVDVISNGDKTAFVATKSS